ncbi:helix-turn-helix domain-containing protein [Roseobacter sinensis]|uniref:Helix-turn-helix domain-containing protein n=1 Tax=Roseobacter sinensis TaxID=2931391 RepID=A0ABT3BEN6_9RHOB|nr:helix-turn-helix domain-containing protein [Roseobacter sp. WL0113]MCV3272025.1 helix-turn-helix domain-containing protein [Roseobacter sp. WL0113]
MAKALSQDPHRTAQFQEKQLEVAIGRQVRGLRRQKGQTIAQLAAEMGISEGMVSKIENGQVSPSLSMLQRLSQAFSVPLTAFFRGYEEQRPVMHVKAGEGIEAERAGTRAGHHYTLLGLLSAQSASVIVEPYLITLTTASDTFETFQHDGMEFLYMLEGEVVYRHGTDLYPLKPGDSLFFDADAPHGPESLMSLPARFLSIICYSKE